MIRALPRGALGLIPVLVLAEAAPAARAATVSTGARLQRNF
jgi:hypothetical protein